MLPRIRCFYARKRGPHDPKNFQKTDFRKRKTFRTAAVTFFYASRLIALVVLWTAAEIWHAVENGVTNPDMMTNESGLQEDYRINLGRCFPLESKIEPPLLLEEVSSIGIA